MDSIDRLRKNQLRKILPKLFGRLDTDDLDKITEHLEWIQLKANSCLIKEGGTGDSLFILISGRLEALVSDEYGNNKFVGEISKGESVGEMALFTGAPRTASIYAIRDSVLVQLTKESFDKIAEQFPKITMTIASIIIKRLSTSNSQKKVDKPWSNLTLVPASSDVDVHAFAERLKTNLEAFGKIIVLDSPTVDKLMRKKGISQVSDKDDLQIRINGWLDEQEEEFDFNIYITDTTTSNWTRRSIRQADRVLVIGESYNSFTPNDIERELLGKNNAITRAGQSLILLHYSKNRRPKKTNQWLRTRAVDSHFHIRWELESDFERLARILSGNAVGLVLGGGGARGFAHIGAIRAIREAGIPIDYVGGTSMGSIVGVHVALESDYEKMVERSRFRFVNQRPLRSVSLPPLLSLMKGNMMKDRIKEEFGDIQIEDLWLPYFSISSNISTSEMMVHRRGELWIAVQASASLPGILPPVIHNNHLLIDGGLINNVPADVMRGICPGKVIVIDAYSQPEMKIEKLPTTLKIISERLKSQFNVFAGSREVPDIFEILMRANMMNSTSRTNKIKAEADYFLQPPTYEFGLLQFSALDKIVDIGYQYAKEQIRFWDVSKLGKKERVES